MVFSSTVFLFLFLPITLIIYYNPIIHSKNFKNVILLISSLLFYAYGEPIFVFFMIFSIIINYFLVILLTKNKNKKIFVIIACIYNLSILFVFKYFTFIFINLNLLLNNNDNISFNIALPIGISFFTFQILSYVIDVYRNPKKAQKNIVNIALYVSLFPQLIAGPIVRYETIANELENRNENLQDFVKGIYRFVYGLGKKVLISNYIGLISDNIFYTVGIVRSEISVCTAWIGAIAYALQIYFDFSGYSDMAIGLGRMFGFHFDENFNYPYIAKSITDFWRRWHISLSTWFRDYLYIPLGGNRVSDKRWMFNLFVVWLFTGIWHGANWTFLVWGIYYFIFLVLEKKTKILKIIGKFSHLYTGLIVLIAWVIFRADNMSIAIFYLENMFGIKAISFFDDMTMDYIKASGIVMVLGIIFSTPLITNIWKKLKINYNIKSIIHLFCTLSIFIFSILSCISATYNPFIYFNF